MCFGGLNALRTIQCALQRRLESTILPATTATTSVATAPSLAKPPRFQQILNLPPALFIALDEATSWHRGLARFI